MNIELEIQELIMHGFKRGERHQIGAAVQRELTRLLSERALPPRLTTGGVTQKIDAGSFSATPNSADTVGTQLAGAVYRGIAQ